MVSGVIYYISLANQSNTMAKRNNASALRNTTSIDSMLERAVSIVSTEIELTERRLSLGLTKSHPLAQTEKIDISDSQPILSTQVGQNMDSSAQQSVLSVEGVVVAGDIGNIEDIVSTGCQRDILISATANVSPAAEVSGAKRKRKTTKQVGSKRKQPPRLNSRHTTLTTWIQGSTASASVDPVSVSASANLTFSETLNHSAYAQTESSLTPFSNFTLGDIAIDIITDTMFERVKALVDKSFVSLWKRLDRLESLINQTRSAW